ncbi:MAG TPA: ABC transporter ATP-binding protein [Caldilineaceae bacterium]|nr:ABC transporter ATP-binding protein [Caldilineaceae bacterium]
MPPLLEARNVNKTYGGGFLNRKQTVALEAASVTIAAETPTIIAIAGESGSGKTTLARLLLGMTPPTTGQILYKGQDLQTLDQNQWRIFRREVQAVFQDPFEVYNPFYKVDHALTTPVAKFFPNATATETRRMIEEALQAVGLRPEETLGRYPHQLSGGQRQRIMVARALLLKPKIIVADEPVSMVDASLRATILESLLAAHKSFDISIIYITHDLTTAYQLSERILMMYRGNVVEAGAVDLVIKAPQHPYTQLLIDSIPLPNPKVHWGQQTLKPRQPTNGQFSAGCAFSDRCPQVLERCFTAPPPFYTTDPRREVACYLYEQS